jgi:hypothetical protein
MRGIAKFARTFRPLEHVGLRPISSHVHVLFQPYAKVSLQTRPTAKRPSVFLRRKGRGEVSVAGVWPNNSREGVTGHGADAGKHFQPPEEANVWMDGTLLILFDGSFYDASRLY